MNNNQPENKIYLTYKTRMLAEAKIRQSGRWLNNLVSWYSFCLIIISLLHILNVYKIYQADFIFTTCSIAIFGLSLFSYGERYFEKADQFRNCYLELQSLFEGSLETKSKMKKYSEILNKYQNQRDDDYDEMLFYAWTRNQSLHNAVGPVKITWQRLIIVLARITLRYGYFTILYLFPVAILTFGYIVDGR